MNRRPRALPVRAALLCALLLATAVVFSPAAPALRSLPTSVAASIATLLVGGGAKPVPAARPARPLASPRRTAILAGPHRLPAWMYPGGRPPIDLTRQIPQTELSVQAAGSIPSTNDVPRLAINQTTVPRPPKVGISAPSDDIQPTWAPNESPPSIYFASNRSNPDGSGPPGQYYHIWKMTGDGSQVVQVTGLRAEEANKNQFYPTVSQTGLIAFSEGAGAGADSYIVVLDAISDPTTPPKRIIVTGPGTPAPRNALGDVIQPSWSPSSSSLAVAANQDTPYYNIFTINLSSGGVHQLTNGTPANKIDSQHPNWSPAGSLVAFDSTAAGVDKTTGLLTAPAATPTRNIFVSSISGPNTAGAGGTNTQPFVQMTKFPGANSIEPAFSVKAGGSFPNDTNNLTLLAFASQRGDPKDTGTADTVEPTYHLFWIVADNGKNAPSTTDSTAEDPMSNPAVSIFTADTDPNLPPALRYKADERHPSWPTFPDSIRVAYQSNLNVSVDPSTGAQVTTIGASNDIWTTSFLDVNAPSLQAFVGSSEIVRVAPPVDPVTGKLASPADAAIGQRQFNPGDTVVIMSKVTDLESGILRTSVDGKMVPTVYAQIRNPNGKYQGADGKEHKTYFREPGAPGDPGAPQNPIPPVFIRPMFSVAIPQEQSSEVIDVRDPKGTTYAHPWYPNTEPIPLPPPPDPLPDPYCPPLQLYKVDKPTYVPGQDDAGAWSGKDHPARGEWLPLYDDGPISKGGHEPEGQMAGDGVFSNSWATPSIPSDYIIDIITYDRAFDPLGRGKGQNWKIWDNVWGFTTQQFVPHNPILAVMDYPEGQRFLSVGGGGRFRRGGSTPVESYLLDLAADGKDSLYPMTLPPMDPNACPPEMPNALVSGSGFFYGDGLGPRNTLGAFSFRNNGYDLWRVICRGPIDSSVLQSYTPKLVDQVDPAAFDQAPSPTGKYSTIKVPAAEKAVYWASPYTGDLWVEQGTLTDTKIRDLLKDFVLNKNGRLFITGQDIGWALTTDGSVDDSFYRDVLKAQYVVDGLPGNPDSYKLTAVTDGDIADDWPNRDVASPLSPRIKEIPSDPYQDPTQTRAPDTLYILTHPDMVQTDGAFDQDFVDHVKPLTGAMRAYTFADGQGDAAIYNIDPKPNGGGGRVVYLSFGLESLLREYDSGQGNTEIVLNFRAKLLHNALCWATTGRIRGRVVSLDVSGIRPVAGAVVRATPDPNNKNGAVPRTAVTDANGEFTIQGLVPQPKYDLAASVPGYTSEHLTSPAVHGIGADPGEVVSLGADLIVSAVATGSISGTVRNSAGSAVPGAVIQATLKPSQTYVGPVVFEADTNGQGQYHFANLPVGSYTLTIEPTFLQASGYTSANPPSLSAGVVASKDSPNANFTLTPGGGTPSPTPTPTPTPTPGTGLKSFPPGLVMLSVPYDYPNDDAAALLGLQPSDLTHIPGKQELAVYMNDTSGFAFYASPDASHFRLGRGYFVRLAKAGTITKTGTPAPTNQPYNLALNAGWNLIGDPFPGQVKWADVKVQVPGQNTPLTVAQAVQQGVVKSDLLTLGGSSYNPSPTLDPWVGYWVHVTKPVTLMIPPPGTTGSQGTVTTPASQPNGELPPTP